MEITIQLSKLFDRDIVSVSLEVWIRNCSVRKLSSALFYEHLVGFLRSLRWVFLYMSLLWFPVRFLAVDPHGRAKRAGSILVDPARSLLDTCATKPITAATGAHKGGYDGYIKFLQP